MHLTYRTLKEIDCFQNNLMALISYVKQHEYTIEKYKKSHQFNENFLSVVLFAMYFDFDKNSSYFMRD